jgi:hypothetical protein
MARIEGVPRARAGLLTRIAYWMAAKMVGKVSPSSGTPLSRVPTPLTVTAHNAWIFRAYAGYELALGKASRVDPKLKALAGIKAATLVGCPF